MKPKTTDLLKVVMEEFGGKEWSKDESRRMYFNLLAECEGVYYDFNKEKFYQKKIGAKKEKEFSFDAKIWEQIKEKTNAKVKYYCDKFGHSFDEYKI